MGFLAYAQKTNSNIIPQQEFEDLVHEVFNVIASNLCRSLGPLGSSATILDGMTTEATKDGYSILKHYWFNNSYKRLIYNLILAPCTKMNNTTGDGTTTVIAFTNELFNQYKEQKSSLNELYYLPRDFNKAWDECVNEIIEEIKKRSTPLTQKDTDKIYNIAYVTSNGNEEVSREISSIYSQGNLPAIKKKKSPSNKSFSKKIDGYDLPSYLIDSAYTTSDDLSAEVPSACVLIFDRTIDIDTFENIIIPINDIMIASNKKLIVLASKYENQLCETMLKQYISKEKKMLNSINLYLVQFNNSKLKDYQLSDLSVILNCKIINNDLFTILKERFEKEHPEDIIDDCMKNETYDLYGIIGTCKSANLTCMNGCIFRPDVTDNPRLEATKQIAKINLENIINSTEYERQNYSEKVYDAQNRINQLNMNNYIYYVGANSELQRQVLEDSVEDVIKCLESAFKYGTVPGSQLTIMRIIDDIKNTKYQNKIKIPRNLDNLSEEKIKEYKNLPEDRILNKHDELRLRIFDIIGFSISKVYEKVIMGPEGNTLFPIMDKYLSDKSPNILKEINDKRKVTYRDILDISKEQNMAFNLETLRWDPNIITSAETDIMVLLVASELIKILISGNQCIICNQEIKDIDTVDMEAYKD